MPKGFRQYDRVGRQHAGGSEEVPLALAGAKTGHQVDTSQDPIPTDKGTFSERMKDAPGRHEGHVPHPGGGQPAEWWWDTQPGIGANWLPQGLFPELDELRDEHLARLADKAEAGRKKGEVIAGFEAEDAARNAALYAGDESPSVTSTAGREDAVRQADAELYAATRRLHDFYLHAVETIKKTAPAWRAQFAATRAARHADMEAAREALRKAEREAANVDQAEQWVDRTVTPRGGRYIEAPTLGVGFMTEAELEDYRRGVRDIEGEMNAQEPAHV